MVIDKVSLDGLIHIKFNQKLFVPPFKKKKRVGKVPKEKPKKVIEYQTESKPSG
jgi:hypothetical protein